MLEQVQYLGYWWLPSNPGVSFAGTLVFSQTKGAFLDLKGFLPEGTENRRHEYDTITGETPQGLRITLCKCSTETTNYNTVSTIRAQWVFVGEHLPKLEDIKVKRLTVNYSGIGDLIDKNKLWWFLVRLPDESRKNWVTFLTKTIANSCELSLIVRPLEEIPQVENIEANIESVISLAIKSINSKSFKNYLVIEAQIFDFLNFILPSTITKKSISSVVENVDSSKVDSEYHVEILYKSPLGRIDKNALGDAKLFMHGQALDRLDSLLARWFDIENRLQPVYNLFFGGMYNSAMYIEFRFLGYAQALEVYHRLTMDHENPTKTERASDIQTILSRCREYEGWLTEIFESSFSMSFLERVSELFDKFHEICTLYFKFNNKESFVTAVKNARNYYTHYSKNLKKKVLQDHEFFWLTKDTELLLRLCILSELGYEITTLNEALYTEQLRENKKGIAQR